MRVLVLDNYDSFTWNLVQALEALDGECVVRRSDQVTLEEVRALAPRRILISPGPFGPDQAGICPDVVQELTGKIPILGVCLGMQVIAAVSGARIVPGRPMHGKTSVVRHDGEGVFHSLPNPITAARYHSLVVKAPDYLPFFEISAWADDGTPMGCRIHGLGVEGVQFHPESFLTEYGSDLLFNFLYRSQLW
jgi:anthranilate synthase/aminodeoxychorismate synthase-like glutamine amidotransferase